MGAWCARERKCAWCVEERKCAWCVEERKCAWCVEERNCEGYASLKSTTGSVCAGEDVCLLEREREGGSDKTTHLVTTSAGTGLKINLKKTELMKINTTVQLPVTVGGEPIKEVESFIYLGSVMDRQGGTDRDIKSRIGKARAAFTMLKNIWASKNIRITTKLRILNSNVKSVLLYGAETWRMTKTTLQKIQTFTTPVSGASSTSDGLKRSQMKNYGREQGRNP
ncbi:uncharacterized protein LOC130047300 [Ostrea edulis]|uniref:uncharacterized protein LOC130047300 n=1 Tax=Ostrea edulis TaxID=37623 RepID=UPI0024AF332E|nr:uncharacterized protein LOC130047300 [Ostrea edulis]